MKRKFISIMFTALFAGLVAGCGEENAEFSPSVSSVKMGDLQQESESGGKAATAQGESTASEATTQGETPASTTAQGESTVTGENTGAEESTKTNEPATMAEELTFAGLATRCFEFSSGAGAWAESFTIEKDGYFTGSFHDSDMGVTGEGYPDGTRYSSSYSGHFTGLVKIDDTTYEMKLKDISYREEAGTEDLADNVRYIYTESYCLSGTDTFRIYLPGTPLYKLSEEIQIWVRGANGSENELTIPIITDEKNGYGIYSYERPTPLEDARMTYNSYKESYDYYAKLMTEASTTMEMVEYSAKMYELGDTCLNYIWNLIRYNVEGERYDKILAEQREWIAKKEKMANDSASQYEGGSFAAVDYNDVLATLTIERCEELLEYLK